jgi:Sulfatase-modifying factor enzyme 1/TIR domain
MSKIFISYRRDDSAGYAQAIYSQLVQHFSKDRVFMDVDTVEPGVDFVRVIETAVGECEVLLAFIGKRWASVGSGTTNRLDDPEDFVRLEISTALARDIRVIPVLVDGVTMPSGETLPASLKLLSRRNAIEISNTRFNFDVERLITTVRKVLDEADSKRKADEEKERNRAEQEAEQRRLEAEAQRKAEEERLREQERQRSDEEAKRKADEDRRRIEEERNRAQQEAEQRRLEAEAQRKLEEERLGEQKRQRSEEEARRKTDEENRTRIDQKLPSPWRTYGPLAAAVAVVLILFSFVFWWPKQQGVFRDRLKNGQEGPEMVVIPAGSFQMGDLQGGGDKDELPVHTVKFQKPFAIGRYEVTFEEYDQFAKAGSRQLPNDQGWGRGHRPVINVSWQDAVAYAKWLSAQTVSSTVYLPKPNGNMQREEEKKPPIGGVRICWREWRTALVAVVSGINRPRRWDRLSRIYSVCTTRRVMCLSG